MKKTLRLAGTGTAVLFWLILWYVLARLADLDLVLPSPETVFIRLWALLGESAFYRTLFISFLRIFAGFFAGYLLGFLLGYASWKLSAIRTLFSPFMAIIRATPVASFIVVVLLWIPRDSVPGLISFLMVLPIVWQNTFSGLESLDPKMEEMATVFCIPPFRRFFLIRFPQVFSAMLAAGKTGLGLAWKAGVAAEVIALPKVSIGAMIYNARLYLETVDLYAWTAAIILVSVLLEKLFTAFLTRLGGRYDPHEKP